MRPPNNNKNIIYQHEEKWAQFRAHSTVKIKLTLMNINMITKKAKGEQSDEKHLKSAGDCETKT